MITVNFGIPYDEENYCPTCGSPARVFKGLFLCECCKDYVFNPGKVVSGNRLIVVPESHTAIISLPEKVVADFALYIGDHNFQTTSRTIGVKMLEQRRSSSHYENRVVLDTFKICLVKSLFGETAETIFRLDWDAGKLFAMERNSVAYKDMEWAIFQFVNHQVFKRMAGYCNGAGVYVASTWKVNLRTPNVEVV